jgi:glycosyltransferase involved in cell wall biosynthesis
MHIEDQSIFWVWHSTFDSAGLPIDPNLNITSSFRETYFKKNTHILVRFSLLGGGYPSVTVIVNNLTKKLNNLGILSIKIGPIRYLLEIFFSFFFVIFFGYKKVFICFDPLSAFIPSFFNKLGYVKSVIFITPDFSRERFGNGVLNSIYYFIDEFCTHNCSINVCNSDSVIDYKKSIYRSRENNFYYLPNIPILTFGYNSVFLKKDIIIVSNLNDVNTATYVKIFEAIEECNKRLSFPVKLNVYGDGTMLQDLISLCTTKSVVFHGRINYKDALSEIFKHKIGLAIYDGNFSYDEFRDSVKIREYQALLCVPITTDALASQSKEVLEFGTGLVIDKNFDSEDLASVICSLMIDDEKYKHLTDNIINWNSSKKNTYSDFYSKIYNYL